MVEAVLTAGELFPNGESIKNAVLILAGNVFIIIFIIRSVGAFAKREWGELVVNFLAGVIIVGLVYFTDSSVQVMKTIWSMIFG
jgi:hypothetical protein